MALDLTDQDKGLSAFNLPPRVLLTEGPAPVRALPALASAWGVGGLWLKCDGLTAPLYAGNKPRKLEWLLADARGRGAQRLCTFGVTGSNHCLATAIHGRAHGFGVEIVTIPQPPSARAERNFAALRATGAEIIALRAREVLPFAVLWHRLRARWQRDPRLYIVPPGGSSSLGTLGFVSAAFELASQVRQGACPAPDVLYVPFGTGGTFAGLWLGCALAGLKTQVVGVRVVDWIVCNEAVAWQLAARTAGVLYKAGADGGALRRALSRPLRVVHDQFGSAYAAPTPAGEAALAALSAAGGPDLEPTYTAKALAALEADARRGLLRERTAMFWNTYNLHPLPSDLV